MLIMTTASKTGAQRLMKDGLLNVRHEEVRRHTASLLQLLARMPVGHAYALQLLIGSSAAADGVPHHCATFYQLFCALVHAIPDMPQQVPCPSRFCF